MSEAENARETNSKFKYQRLENTKLGELLTKKERKTHEVLVAARVEESISKDTVELLRNKMRNRLKPFE
jgi:hypothetical protein